MGGVRGRILRETENRVCMKGGKKHWECVWCERDMCEEMEKPQFEPRIGHGRGICKNCSRKFGWKWAEVDKMHGGSRSMEEEMEKEMGKLSEQPSEYPGKEVGDRADKVNLGKLLGEEIKEWVMKERENFWEIWDAAIGTRGKYQEW